MGARGPDHDVDRLRREVGDLQTALARRDVIGQAKGMLMERHGIGTDEAFERLVRISQATNTKLHAVAVMVVSDGAGDGLSDGASDGGGGPVPPGRDHTGVD